MQLDMLYAVHKLFSKKKQILCIGNAPLSADLDRREFSVCDHLAGLLTGGERFGCFLDCLSFAHAHRVDFRSCLLLSKDVFVLSFRCSRETKMH